jgi:hypothetical protein
MDKRPVRHDDGPARRALDVDGPTHRSFARLESNGRPCQTVEIAWQQSLLPACPQEVKDGVEDGTQVGGARSRRRQNWRNKSPSRVGQLGVVESSAHRTVPVDRVSALSRQTSTFQTPSYALLTLTKKTSRRAAPDARKRSPAPAAQQRPSCQSFFSTALLGQQ